jgi:hypothetical protein
MWDLLLWWIGWGVLDWAWKGFVGAAVMFAGAWLWARYRRSPWQAQIQGAVTGCGVVAIIIMATLLLVGPTSNTRAVSAVVPAPLTEPQQSLEIAKYKKRLADINDIVVQMEAQDYAKRFPDLTLDLKTRRENRSEIEPRCEKMQPADTETRFGCANADARLTQAQDQFNKSVTQFRSDVDSLNTLSK